MDDAPTLNNEIILPINTASNTIRRYLQVSNKTG
jgi:hypothetical protein